MLLVEWPTVQICIASGIGAHDNMLLPFRSSNSYISARWMKNFQPLPKSFYEPSAKIVAPQLLGHWLIRNTPNGPCGGPIVETEAYLSDDPACHGAPGPTPRNRVM